MAKANLTGQAQIDVSIREIDFVTRFGRNWQALLDILGIMRPIRKTPGTKLVSYTAGITLQDGEVGEGEEIPYSQATVQEAYFEDLNLEKYAKAVSIEAVNKYGAINAINRTDEAFLNQLQMNVMNRFYSFIQTGTMVSSETTFQMGLSMAKGRVVDKFKKMNRDCTAVVAFVNTLDLYKYLGSANVTVQTMFGFQYIQNFLGVELVIVSSAIPQGKIIATPVENIDLYYIDPSDGQFQQLGLTYTVDGVTNLIGFHANGNYNTAVGESFALCGMKLWAEYLDAIAVVTVSALAQVEVTADAQSDELYGVQVSAIQKDDVTVAPGAITGTLIYQPNGMAQSGPLAGAGYFMGLKFDATWANYTSVKIGLDPTAGTGLVEIKNDDTHTAALKLTNKNTQKLVVVATNGTDTREERYDLSGLKYVTE